MAGRSSARFGVASGGRETPLGCSLRPLWATAPAIAGAVTETRCSEATSVRFEIGSRVSAGSISGMGAS